MEDILMRLALFTALPALLGAAIVMFDPSAVGPVRRAEAFLIPLFIIGVGGSGVSEFITHVFISGPAARSLGREPGSPFQLDLGVACLAIGLLGAVAAERRDGFREATVAAASIFAAGVLVVQFMDAAGSNLLRSLFNLATPGLLIWFLVAVRRAERAEPPTIVLRSWMIPVRRASVFTVGIAASALPIGYATGQMVTWPLAAMVVAAAVFWLMVSRAASHRAKVE